MLPKIRKGTLIRGACFQPRFNQPVQAGLHGVQGM
jgi:hypothetical protein